MPRKTKQRQGPLALIYCVIILTLMEYFFIPPRAEVWLRGNPFSNWMIPSLDAGLVWSASCVIGYFLIPIFIIKKFSKEDLANYGLSFVGFWKHLRTYVGLYMLMIPLIYLASQQPDFKGTYPFVPEAKNSLGSFVIWETGYVIQFFALESFFRGYLLFTFEKYMEKWMAISMMLVPYVMIHYHKPVFEAFGAIFAGLILGWLSLRYRSWLGGAVLHSLVAVTLDILATR